MFWRNLASEQDWGTFLPDPSLERHVPVMAAEVVEHLGCLPNRNFIDLTTGSGGHAMAIMAGNLMGTIQSQGISASMATQTPEGESNQLKQLEVAPSVMDNAHKFDFRRRAEAGILDRRSQTRASVDTIDQVGGVDNAVSLLSRSRTIGNLQKAGEAEQRSLDGARHLGGLEGRMRERRAENLSLSDADQVGLVRASNEKYGAWRDPAQEMVASGLVFVQMRR